MGMGRGPSTIVGSPVILMCRPSSEHVSVVEHSRLDWTSGLLPSLGLTPCPVEGGD